MPIDENTFKNLSNNQIWFSSPLKFNDPFDYFVPINLDFSDDEFIRLLQKSQNIPIEKCKQILKYYKDNPEELEKWFEIGHSRFASNSRVACFCEEKSNILMWSHYANYHKGICLKFDSFCDNGFFHDENWNLKKLPITKVNYPIKYNPPKYFKDNEEFFKYSVYTKYHKWKYEKEHRIISIVDIIKYEKKSLIEVIFGCKCDEEKQQEVVEMVRANNYPNVKFIQAIKHKDKFGLKFEEIK